MRFLQARTDVSHMSSTLLKTKLKETLVRLRTRSREQVGGLGLDNTTHVDIKHNHVNSDKSSCAHEQSQNSDPDPDHEPVKTGRESSLTSTVSQQEISEREMEGLKECIEDMVPPGVSEQVVRLYTAM